MTRLLDAELKDKVVQRVVTSAAGVVSYMLVIFKDKTALKIVVAGESIAIVSLTEEEIPEFMNPR